MQATLAALAVIAVSLALAVPAARAASGGASASTPDRSRPSSCGAAPEVRLEWMQGYDDPATPDNLDRVGVLEIGPANAPNVLVLNPGTSAGAGYFQPLADDIVRDTNGRWQVWSVERRENQLEDQFVFDQAKRGLVTPQQMADYYLSWLTNPSITNHFQPIPDSAVAYAKNWGLNVEIGDLHRVVEAARLRARRVVLGGHSLGGSITTAYATWDFNGVPGANDLDGLVFIDGGSSPTPISAADATQRLQSLENGSPWLAFGGIPAPYAGLFIEAGSLEAILDPNGPSIGQSFALLPAELKPPVPVTNEAQFGYALDTKTSPPSLAAAQAHLGQLAASGNPRPWNGAGALTPIQRFAQMFAARNLSGIDGSAWYHPLRLTLDSGAVADGNANPAQSVLDVKAIHGHDLSRRLRIYAFGAALGGTKVLASAQTLADQSRIPSSHVTLIDRHDTYAHNDPAGASPTNDFLANLIPFLDRIGPSGHCFPGR